MVQGNANNAQHNSIVQRALVVTVSDSRSRGENEDRSGAIAVAMLKEQGVEVVRADIVPDEIADIERILAQGIAEEMDIIFTTGGTGIGPRDVTPEAAASFIHQPLPGINQQIVAVGLAVTPFAALSRGGVGIHKGPTKRTLIINAPGSPGGVKDTLNVVGPLLPHIASQFAGGGH